MIKFLTFLLLSFIGISTAAAQQIVDKKSFDSAIKTLREQTAVPLKLPTYFIVPDYLTAKERKRPLKVIVSEAKPDSFALAFCYSGICQGSFNYGEISGEKITPQTEKPVFDKTVKLAREITGYYQEGSCGASCGNAWMFWEQDGYLYSLSLSVDDVETLTKVVNSAINNNRLTARTPVRKEISNTTNRIPPTAEFESVEAFLKSAMKAGDKLEFQTKGDLNGDGLEDWAGVLQRKKTENDGTGNVFDVDATQIYVLLQQPDSYQIAEKSKEGFLGGSGCCWVEDLEIRRSSLFLQINAKTAGTMKAMFYQLKLYKNEWRLVGLRVFFLEIEPDESIETDMNLLTGTVIEKKQKGERKPVVRRSQKKFPGYFLKNFDFESSYGPDPDLK